jgi:hypothetical protein
MGRNRSPIRFPRKIPDSRSRPAVNRTLDIVRMIKKTLLVLAVIYLGYQGIGRARDAMAMRYFHQQCEKYGGEFIYRTVDNVEGVFQMRPRDPRDYFDRLRKGDIPEDPYGHTNLEAIDPEYIYLSLYEPSYDYFEKIVFSDRVGSDGSERIRHYYRVSVEQRPMPFLVLAKPQSEYGYWWREEQSAADTRHGVRVGITEVVRLADKTVFGLKRGYFIRTPFEGRLAICPNKKDDPFIFEFVRKVLKPIEKH